MANGLLALLSALNGYGQGNLWRQHENERRAKEQAAQANVSGSAPNAPTVPFVPSPSPVPNTPVAPNVPRDTTSPANTALAERLAREIVPPPYHHHLFQDLFAPLQPYGSLWQGQEDSQDDTGDDVTDRQTPSLPWTPASGSGRFMPLVPPVSSAAMQAAMPSPGNGRRTVPGLPPTMGPPASRVAAGYSSPTRSASGLPMQSGQATFLHRGIPVTYTVTT